MGKVIQFPKQAKRLIDEVSKAAQAQQGIGQVLLFTGIWHEHYSDEDIPFLISHCELGQDDGAFENCIVANSNNIGSLIS